MWRHAVLMLIILCLAGLTGCATTQKKVAIEEEPLYPMTQELKEEISRLEDMVEGLSEQTADLSKRTNSLENRVSLLNQPMQAREEYTPPPSVTPTEPMTGSVQAAYNTALDEYYNRDFEKAMGKFRQIITGHPRSTLADNSQYWLAECYYGLEDYPRAIEEFRKVFSYADTEKDDDAQLKLGFCYTNMGDATQAVAEFRKLLNLYPDSEFADVARRRIEELSR
jgi:tol-pal system protein YbgF